MAKLTTYQEAIAVIIYLKLWLQDVIQHYYVRMILLLPKYMFGSPILRIQKFVDSSDEETHTDNEIYPIVETYDLYVFQCMLVFKPDAEGNVCHQTLHGSQLYPIVNATGCFHIAHLIKFYPNLDLILLKYVKVLVGKKISAASEHTKVITVDNKLDIYNKQSCKLGVVF